MAHESGIIARWVANKLTNDEQLTVFGFGVGKVHRVKAIEGCPLPYIIFGMQGGGTDDDNAGARNLTEPLYLIKIVSSDCETMDAYEDALSRIDALFSSVIEESEGHLITVESAGLYEQLELTANNNYLYNQGRYWRLYVTKLGE